MVQLKPGTGRADISPALGTPQGGWGAQTHQRGLGNDLPLYATALVLDEGAHQVAIVDVDSTSFTAKLASSASTLTHNSARGLPATRNGAVCAVAMYVTTSVRFRRRPLHWAEHRRARHLGKVRRLDWHRVARIRHETDRTVIPGGCQTPVRTKLQRSLCRDHSQILQDAMAGTTLPLNFFRR